MEMREDDLSSEATRSLLVLHLKSMHANSPLGSVFALDLSGLRVPEVTVWTAWDANDILGIGALNEIGNGNGELKSMRTHPNHLRKGVGAALLTHMIAEAKTRGLRRLSLETGSGPAFDPALALYRKFGFINGEAFADYPQNAFNQFLHLTL